MKIRRVIVFGPAEVLKGFFVVIGIGIFFGLVLSRLFWYLR